MMDKARTLESDQVFLDLEDACAPLAKPGARGLIAAALNEGGWGDRVRVVRINDVSTQWAYRDVIDVVEAAGTNLDCIMVPKVRSERDVAWVDLLLSQIERANGLDEGGIGLELQIEDAKGLANVDAIARASRRTETIIFGPADFMADIRMRSLQIGEQPPGYEVADAFHYPLMRILVAARAAGLQAIDGPYAQIRNEAGFRAAAGRAAALGFDGKWALHPGQIAPANELFAPTQSDFDHAENILDAYEWHTSSAGGARGAVMLGDEMIDEASRKMALVTSAAGRAMGMFRTDVWAAPVAEVSS